MDIVVTFHLKEDHGNVFGACREIIKGELFEAFTNEYYGDLVDWIEVADTEGPAYRLDPADLEVISTSLYHSYHELETNIGEAEANDLPTWADDYRESMRKMDETADKLGLTI